ncbi:MAG: class I SAM-dependent methyltransferase [Saprospiraceae bacterium]|nr:class I SAM-dependent methyltransferase [Saprospiraceae bacterium]
MKIENPAFDYDQPGHRYAGVRQTDPRIAAFIHQALGDARTVLNVGAGAGSYEPDDRYVVAVEPSAAMRAQRLALQRIPAIHAKADYLPFDDQSFDASMALVTVHHWPDMAKGLRELRRVTSGRMIVMTFDPAALDDFWNVHYFPELIAVEKARYPDMPALRKAMGGDIEEIKIPIPLDCADGFQEAFYGRPEAFLQPEIRRAQSAWGFLPPGLEEELVRRLDDDLKSGAWDKKYGFYRTQSSFTCALRLVVSTP